MADDPENRDAILASAESLIISAVKLLLPICGERGTAQALQQMAVEQARFLSRTAPISEPRATRH